MRLRPLRRDEVPAWAALLAAAEAVDRTGELPVAADLAADLADPEVGTDDVLAVLDGDALVGVARLLPRGETEGAFVVLVDGVVAPSHRGRGLGTALTRRVVHRAVEAARSRRPDLPARVCGRALATDPAQGRLLTDLGLRPDRRTLTMRRRLEGLPPREAAPPATCCSATRSRAPRRCASPTTRRSTATTRASCPGRGPPGDGRSPAAGCSGRP